MHFHLLTILAILTISVLAAPQVPPPLQSTTSSPATTTPPEPSPTDNEDSPKPDCDYAWCDEGTSWCNYFAGITGWDAEKGPVPGTVVTAIGRCDAGGGGGAGEDGPMPTEVVNLPDTYGRS